MGRGLQSVPSGAVQSRYSVGRHLYDMQVGLFLLQEEGFAHPLDYYSSPPHCHRLISHHRNSWGDEGLDLSTGVLGRRCEIALTVL